MININVVKNHAKAKLPEKMTELSAGYDIYACLDDPITLKPGHRVLVTSGIILDLPDNIEVSVRPRSGWALKYGVTILNTPGTIDPDYRGEIKVLLINLGQETITVNPGDRIAQLVFSQVLPVSLIPSDGFSFTDRGDGGYGHTGK